MCTKKNKWSKVKVICHKAAHGRFSRIRQIVPLCTSIYYMVFWSHPPQHPTLHLNRCSRFAQFTAESPDTSQLASLFPSKLPLPMCGSGPSSNTWFLGPTQIHNLNDI